MLSVCSEKVLEWKTIERFKTKTSADMGAGTLKEGGGALDSKGTQRKVLDS